MASKAIAQFALPNGPGLGVADTGQPWKKHRGVDAEIRNGKAYFYGSIPGALYTVDTGSGGGDGTVTCDFFPNDGGGQSLYFRVVDANRWWRLSRRKREYQYQVQTGTTPIVYGWVGDGTYYYKPAGGWVKTGEWALDPSEGAYGTYQTKYYSWDSRVNAYLGREDYVYTKAITYQRRTVHENQVYKQVGGGEPIYTTYTGTKVEVFLDKCVNGIVSNVKWAESTDSMAQFKVVLAGDVIDCFNNDTRFWTAVSDPTHKSASRHGIGYDEKTQFGNGQGIESFSAIPDVITGYIPPVML